jgi:hypothetical protein
VEAKPATGACGVSFTSASFSVAELVARFHSPIRTPTASSFVSEGAADVSGPTRAAQYELGASARHEIIKHLDGAVRVSS